MPQAGPPRYLNQSGLLETSALPWAGCRGGPRWPPVGVITRGGYILPPFPWTGSLLSSEQQMLQCNIERIYTSSLNLRLRVGAVQRGTSGVHGTCA